MITALALVAAAAPRAGATARRTVPARAAAPLVAFDAAFVPGRTEAQREASYRRLRAMGVRAIRLDFSWVALQPIGPPLHDYVWMQQDREVTAIRRAGLKILGILDYGHPDYSRAGGEAYQRGQKPSPPFGVGDPQYYPPDDPRSFARFASDVASHYRSDLIGWEVWNEENAGWRFWEPKEDPRAYGRLLCAAYRGLKRVDRRVPVAFGGLFFPPLGGLVGTGAVKFLTQVLDVGGPAVSRCFDAVAYHPYPYPFTSPEAQVGDRGSVIGAADQLRVVLRRHGIGRTPLWNTEVGWPTDPAGNGVTEIRQARYVARLQLLSWARGVPILTWYTWGDAPDAGATNQEAHFGFFRLDGSPKPAYRALVVLQHQLGGAGWHFVADRSRALRLPGGHDGVGQAFALEFARPDDSHVLALWYAHERPPAGTSPFAAVEPGTPTQAIAVRLPLGNSVRIVDVLGRRRTATRTRAGCLLLHVAQDPLYVAWRARPGAAATPGGQPRPDADA